MIASTKLGLALVGVGLGAIVAGDLVKDVAPQLDAVEKYGVLGLLAILCIGLLALINKLSDNIASNTSVAAELVAVIQLVHQEQKDSRLEARTGREEAVGELMRALEGTRKEIVDEVRRGK